MSAEVRLREMEAGDWRLLRAVRLEALRESPTAFGSTYERESSMAEEEWRERAMKWCDRVTSMTVLAEVRRGGSGVEGEGGAGMGCGVVTEAEGGERRVSIHAMWVAPEVRGRGVGRAIIEQVLGWAMGVGAESARLHVTSGNERAQRLYESMGFVLTGREEAHPVFAGVMHMKMEKRLGSRSESSSARDTVNHKPSSGDTTTAPA